MFLFDRAVFLNCVRSCGLCHRWRGGGGGREGARIARLSAPQGICGVASLEVYKNRMIACQQLRERSRESSPQSPMDGKPTQRHCQNLSRLAPSLHSAF